MFAKSKLARVADDRVDRVAYDRVADGRVADGRVADDGADDGVADDRVADDRVADDRVAENRVADDRAADDRAADDRAADDRAADDRAADDRAADGRVGDGRVADDGADDGVADDRVADDRVADDRVAENRVADDRVADRVTDDRVADDRVTDDRVTDAYATCSDVSISPAFGAVFVLLAACGGAKKPATQAAPSLAHAIAATITAAEQKHAPWRCVADDLPELAAGKIGSWTIEPHQITHAAAPQLAIGVVADAGGDDPKTLAALGRVRKQLDDAQVELVLVLGGMGTTQKQLEATLGVLAKPTSPVVALPGDLESVTAETAAIASLTAKGQPVIDGRLVRWIALPDATIGTIAGAGSPLRLAGGDGCVWQADDVLELYRQLAEKPGLRIAATAEAPREGDAGEVELVPGPAIDALVHGPAHGAPTAAKSGTRDGAKTQLSPGTVDASPRLESHAPSAGVLSLRGTAWSWKPLVDR
ncbi:MAG: hypothetical protein QM831_31310 [Kofleriaceae bacterium]